MIFNMVSGSTIRNMVKIVGGETAPLSPRQNTVWVRTAEPVTGYSFEDNEPAQPYEGMVWFSTEGYHPTPITIGGRNPIVLQPTGCMQYIDGSFQRVPSYVYQSGEWVGLWNGVLYSPGNEWTRFTGGFVGHAIKSTSSSGASAAVPNITRNESDLTITNAGTKGGVVCTGAPIDVTDYDTIHFVGWFAIGGSSSNNLIAGIWHEIDDTDYYATSNQLMAYAKMDSSTATELVIDVSNVSGLAYVGIGLTDSLAEITDIYMT